MSEGRKERRGKLRYDLMPPRSFERVVEVLTYGAEKYTVYGDCTCNLPNTGHAASCQDRKSTRLNSSHVKISYAVFCLKKKSNKYLLADTCVVSAKHSHTEDEAF